MTEQQLNPSESIDTRPDLNKMQQELNDFIHAFNVRTTRTTSRYNILGVHHDSSEEEIITAYQRLAGFFRKREAALKSDKSLFAQSLEVQKQLLGAFEVLKMISKGPEFFISKASSIKELSQHLEILLEEGIPFFKPQSKEGYRVISVAGVLRKIKELHKSLGEIPNYSIDEEELQAMFPEEGNIRNVIEQALKKWNESITTIEIYSQTNQLINLKNTCRELIKMGFVQIPRISEEQTVYIDLHATWQNIENVLIAGYQANTEKRPIFEAAVVRNVLEIHQ